MSIKIKKEKVNIFTIGFALNANLNIMRIYPNIFVIVENSGIPSFKEIYSLTHAVKFVVEKEVFIALTLVHYYAIKESALHVSMKGLLYHVIVEKPKES